MLSLSTKEKSELSFSVITGDWCGMKIHAVSHILHCGALRVRDVQFCNQSPHLCVESSQLLVLLPRLASLSHRCISLLSYQGQVLFKVL